jgi:outer membrane immunogenic protein
VTDVAPASVERFDEERRKMLRIRTLGAGLAASLLIAAGAGSAHAADLSQPTYNAPQPAYTPAQAWSWTGGYVGLLGGYGWGAGTVSNNGWIGGAYAGYNLQTNEHLVVGVEGDIAATSKSGYDGVTTIKNPWDGSFRGRIGYAWGRTMAYGTAGVAVGGLSSTTPSESTTKTGWVAGLGLETALTNNVTGRIEARHTDLGTFPSTGTSYTSNDLLVGVGLKF